MDSLNTIRFYLELDNAISRQMTSFKGDFEKIVDDVEKIADNMVTSIESAFSKIDAGAMVKDFRKALTGIRQAARSMKAVRVPIDVDLKGAITGTALGVAIGNALTKVDIPEQSIAATIKPRLGQRGVTVESMKEIRRKVVEWFQREENAIPLRFSTKISRYTFGGNKKELMDNLKDALSIKELKIDGVDVSGISTVLTDVASNAADVFVQRIQGGLALAGAGGAGGGALGLKLDMPGRSYEAKEALMAADPAQIEAGMRAFQQSYQSGETAEQQKLAFFMKALGRSRSSLKADWFEGTKVTTFDPKDVGIESDLRREAEKSGSSWLVNLAAYLMNTPIPEVPKLAEGGEIVKDVFIKAHKGEAVAPYGKVEKTFEEILTRQLRKTGVTGPGMEWSKPFLSTGFMSQGTGKISAVDPAKYKSVETSLGNTVSELDAAAVVMADAATAMFDAESTLGLLGDYLKTLGWPTEKLEDAVKDATKAFKEAEKAFGDAEKKWKKIDVPEVFQGSKSGKLGGDWRPGAAVLPAEMTRKELSVETTTGGLGVIAGSAIARTGEDITGAADYREVFSVMEAAKESGRSWIEVQNLVNIASKGQSLSFNDLNATLESYRSIMSKADLTTAAGVKTFITTRNAVVNLSKRLRAHQKDVVDNVGEYSDLNLQLEDAISRSDELADNAKKMAEGQRDNASSAQNLTSAFQSLIREAKTLAPVMLTIAGAKVSAKIDTAMIGTREQLANNTQAWAQYRDIATDVMADTMLSIEDVGKVMTLAARRGFESREEIREFAMTVGQAAVAGRGMGADVESAAGTAAYTFQRLGIAVEDMDVAFSHMMRSSRDGSLTLSEVNSIVSQNIEWLQRHGDTSEQATMRMARFAAAAQAVSESFGSAQQGAAGVQQLMEMVTAMADPAQWSGPVAAQMTSIMQFAGVSFDTLMSKIRSRDFAGVMQDLVEAVQNMPLDRVDQFGTAIESLMGVSHEAIMQLKMDPSVATRLQRSLEAIDAAGMDTNELADGMDRFRGGLNESITDLQRSWGRAVDDSFGGINDALTVVVQKVRWLLDQYNELPQGVKSIVGTMAGVVSIAALLAVLTRLAVVLKGVATAMGVMKATSAAQAGTVAMFGRNVKSMGASLTLLAGAVAIFSIVADTIKWLASGDFEGTFTKGFAEALGVDELYKLFRDEEKKRELRGRSRDEYLETVMADAAIANRESAEAMGQYVREVLKGTKKDDPLRPLLIATGELMEQVLRGEAFPDAQAEAVQMYVQTGPRTGELVEMAPGDVRGGISEQMNRAIERIMELYPDRRRAQEAIAQTIPLVLPDFAEQRDIREGDAYAASRYSYDLLLETLRHILEAATVEQGLFQQATLDDALRAIASGMVQVGMTEYLTNPGFIQSIARPEEEAREAYERASLRSSENPENEYYREIARALHRHHLELLRERRIFEYSRDYLSQPEVYPEQWEQTVSNFNLLFRRLQDLAPAIQSVSDIGRDTQRIMMRAASEMTAESEFLEGIGTEGRRFLREQRTASADDIYEDVSEALEQFNNLMGQASTLEQLTAAYMRATQVLQDYRFRDSRDRIEQALDESMRRNLERFPESRDVEEEMQEQDREKASYYIGDSLQPYQYQHGAASESPSKPQITVNTDSPQVVAILQKIANLVGEAVEDGKKTRSKVQSGGNPFFRRAVLGAGG